MSGTDPDFHILPLYNAWCHLRDVPFRSDADADAGAEAMAVIAHQIRMIDAESVPELAAKVIVATGGGDFGLDRGFLAVLELHAADHPGDMA